MQNVLEIFLVILSLLGAQEAGSAKQIPRSHIQPAGIERPCPNRWSDYSRVGTLENQAIDESSGLAESWHNPDLLWTHNDSGDSARLFVLRKDGTHVAEVRLEEADAVDFEDMSIGPCEPEGTDPCVYVGDIGDNLSRRQSVTIYKFPEPALADEPFDPFTISDWECIRFVYPQGPRDAEALMVHPKTAAIYVVEKHGEEESQVFQIPTTTGNCNGEPVAAEPVATLTTTSSIVPYGRMITAGDISPDGMEFTIRTYLELYTYCTPDPEDFHGAFDATPAVTFSPPTIQGEALTYDRADQALWLTSEMLPAPLYKMWADYPDSPPDAPDGGDPADVGPGSDAETNIDGDAALDNDAGLSSDAGPKLDSGQAHPPADPPVEPTPPPQSGNSSSGGCSLGANQASPFHSRSHRQAALFLFLFLGTIFILKRQPIL